MKEGPLYPSTLGERVAKYRRILNPTWEQRQAHGQAVIEAIRRLQRSELGIGCKLAHTPNCASGTFHTDGDKIIAAVQAQNRALLAQAVARDRRRTPGEWKLLYDKAMAAKQVATNRKENGK